MRTKIPIPNVSKIFAATPSINTQIKNTPNRGEQGGNTGHPPYPPQGGKYSRPWHGGYRGRGRGYYNLNYGAPHWQGEGRDWRESYRPPMPVFQTSRNPQEGGGNGNPQEGENVEGESKIKIEN